jgi:hypothetical protein
VWGELLGLRGRRHYVHRALMRKLSEGRNDRTVHILTSTSYCCVISSTITILDHNSSYAIFFNDGTASIIFDSPSSIVNLNYACSLYCSTLTHHTLNLYRTTKLVFFDQDCVLVPLRQYFLLIPPGYSSLIAQLQQSNDPASLPNYSNQHVLILKTLV